MIDPWLGILAVLAALAVLMGVVKLAQLWCRLSAELSRKIVHVGMGLLTVSFPWLFDRVWPVVLLAAVAAVALLIVKCVQSLRAGIGSVLLGVERTSFGEVYFPIAVGSLYVLSFGRWELFVIPMLVLSLADAVAALIGIHYGTLNYKTLDGRKSAEGSVAFFTVAFLSAHVPLLLGTQIGRAETLLIALILGLLVMLLEAVAWRGLDNLFIPLGAFAFLKLYIPLPVDALLLRLAVTLALVVFVLSWRRRSTLDDSALIASALFGYAAAMLGGPAWLAAPIALFLLTVIFWPPDSHGRYHNVYVVICITGTGFFWLFVHVVHRGAGWLLPFSTAFAAHIAFVSISQSAFEPLRQRLGRRLLGSIALGLAAGHVPTLLLLMATSNPSIVNRPWPSLAWDAGAAVAAVAIPATAFYILMPRLYVPIVRPLAIHSLAAALAFTSSCFAATRVLGA